MWPNTRRVPCDCTLVLCKVYLWSFTISSLLFDLRRELLSTVYRYPLPQFIDLSLIAKLTATPSGAFQLAERETRWCMPGSNARARGNNGLWLNAAGLPRAPRPSSYAPSNYARADLTLELQNNQPDTGNFRLINRTRETSKQLTRHGELQIN